MTLEIRFRELVVNEAHIVQKLFLVSVGNDLSPLVPTCIRECPNEVLVE